MKENFNQTIEIIPVDKYGQCATGCTTQIHGALTPAIAKRLAGGGWHNVRGIDRDGNAVMYKVRFSNVYKVVEIPASAIEADREELEKAIAENDAMMDKWMAEEDARNALRYAEMYGN